MVSPHANNLQKIARGDTNVKSEEGHESLVLTLSG